MITERFSAIKVGGEEHGPKRQRSGRVCASAECTTLLSVYNDGAFCYRHQPMSTPRTRGRKIVDVA
ncbi:MAG: hypothetical protein ACYDH5_05815 [Acidimicrobiales bacterium]